MSLSGRRILIIQQRNWGLNVGHFLAKKLSAEGARLAALTHRKGTHEFHTSQTDVKYESLVNTYDILENPEKYLGGRRFSLDEITRALRIRSIWPLVYSDREIARSYGQAFNYAPRQQVSDKALRLYIEALYAYINDLFETFRPEVIIAPRLAGPANLMLYHMGRIRGVRSLFITDSKVRGWCIATFGPVEDEGPFYDRVDELNAGAESSYRTKAQRYISEFRKSLKRPTYVEKLYRESSFVKRIREELAPYRRIWEWYVRPHEDYSPAIGVTQDHRPPRIILRDHYVKKWRSYQARQFRYDVHDNLDKFVFYPLQVEPELTLDVLAPYFSNQKELVRLISMSLPGDYSLVVKDHPAMMGFRSNSELKDIAGTPNVLLVDSRIPNEVLLKKASLVVAPNSTALVEAAFYGTPALQFGDQGTTQKLPNVCRHTDLTTLSDVLTERLNTKLGGPEYERRLENFVAAVYDVGHDVDFVAAWEEGKQDEVEGLWEMYRKELALILR